MSLAAIIKLLPALTPEDLQKLKVRVAALLATGPSEAASTPSQPGSGQDWILTGIALEIESRGLMGGKVEARLKRLPQYPIYLQNVKKARAALAKWIDPIEADWPKVKLRSLGIILGRAQYDYLDDRRQRKLERQRRDGEAENAADITAELMMISVDNLPVAIEHSFPGYLQSGMLPFLVDMNE